MSNRYYQMRASHEELGTSNPGHEGNTKGSALPPPLKRRSNNRRPWLMLTWRRALLPMLVVVCLIGLTINHPNSVDLVVSGAMVKAQDISLAEEEEEEEEEEVDDRNNNIEVVADDDDAKEDEERYGYCEAQGLEDAGDGTCKNPDVLTIIRRQQKDPSSDSSTESTSSSSSSSSSASSSSASSSETGSSSLPNPFESKEMMDIFKDTTDFVVSLVDGRLIAFDGCGTKLWTYTAKSPTVEARFNETAAKGLGSGDWASHFAADDPTRTPRIVPALDGTVYIVTPNPQSPSQIVFTHLPTLLEDMVSVAPFYSPAFPGMYVTGSKLQGGTTVDFSKVEWHIPSGPLPRYMKKNKLVFARQEWALHSLAAEDSEEVWRASYAEFPPVTHEHLFAGTEVNARARALTSVIGILDNQTSVYKKIADHNRCPTIRRAVEEGQALDEPLKLVFDSPVVGVFAVVNPQDTPAKLGMVPVAHAGPWCHEFPGYDKLPIPSYVNMPHAYDGRPQLYPPFTYNDGQRGRHPRGSVKDEEPYYMYKNRRRSPEPLQLALEGGVTLDEMASIFIKLNGPNRLFFGGLGGDYDMGGGPGGPGGGRAAPPGHGSFGQLPDGGANYHDEYKIRPLSLPGPGGSYTTVDPAKVHYLNDVARNTSLREFLAVKYQHNYIVLIFLLGLMGFGAVVYRFIAGWVQVFKVVAPDGEGMSPGLGQDDDEMSEDEEMEDGEDDAEDSDFLSAAASMDLIEQPYDMGKLLDIKQDIMYIPEWQDILLQTSLNKRLQQFNDLTRIAFKHGESDVRTLHGGVLFLGRNVDDPQFIFRNPKQELSQRPNVPKYTQAVRNAVAGNAMKEVRYLKAYCPKACVASWNTFEGVIQDFVCKHPTDSHVSCRDVDPEVARDASLIIMALRDTDAHEDNMMRDKLGRIALFDLGCALADRPLPRDDMTQEYLDNFAFWHQTPLVLDAPFTSQQIRYLKSLDFEKLRKIWSHFNYPGYVVAECERARRRGRLRRSSRGRSRSAHTRSHSTSSPGVVRQALGYLVSPRAAGNTNSEVESGGSPTAATQRPLLPLVLPQRVAGRRPQPSQDDRGSDRASSSPSPPGTREGSEGETDNATSSGEEATVPRKPGSNRRRARAETFAVAKVSREYEPSSNESCNHNDHDETTDEESVGDYDEVRMVPTVDMVNVMEANVRFLLRCAETDKPMLFAAEVMYSGLYERVWHDLPGGVTDFESLGDTLVDIASVESVYDIFTDWDDRRTGHRHVDMLWAGPPRPLPLCNGHRNGDATDTSSDKLLSPADESMSCRSGSVASRFDGEIEMVGFDDDNTSVEMGTAASVASGRPGGDGVTTSESEEGEAKKKTKKNVTIRIDTDIPSVVAAGAPFDGHHHHPTDEADH